MAEPTVKPIYIWYIEPIGDRTNKAIYEYCKNISLDDIIEPAICADGKKHNLWECSFETAMYFYESKQNLNLRFEIWGKQGFKGKIRKKTFLFTSKWQKRKKRKKKKTPI